MNILVTGAHGFAGSHLVELLEAKKHTVFAPKFDLLNATEVATALSGKTFDGVMHLAAIATTGSSFNAPGKVLKNNILAQVNLLETLRQQKRSPKILLVCSADEYGRGSDEPLDEAAPLRPTTPYAVSKIAQDFMGLQYFLSYGMKIVRVRPFNHVGERQAPGFVVPDFAQQIVAIEKSNKPGVMRVGNLKATRDFTDVKDMVGAYELALTKGEAGDVYNIGSGIGVTIQKLLDTMVRLSRASITIETDPAKFRPGEEPKLVCNPQKFHTLTGWTSEIPLETTLSRVLEWWRKQS